MNIIEPIIVFCIYQIGYILIRSLNIKYDKMYFVCFNSILFCLAVYSILVQNDAIFVSAGCAFVCLGLASITQYQYDKELYDIYMKLYNIDVNIRIILGMSRLKTVHKKKIIEFIDTIGKEPCYVMIFSYFHRKNEVRINLITSKNHIGNNYKKIKNGKCYIYSFNLTLTE